MELSGNMIIRIRTIWTNGSDYMVLCKNTSRDKHLLEIKIGESLQTFEVNDISKYKVKTYLSDYLFNSALILLILISVVAIYGVLSLTSCN